MSKASFDEMTGEVSKGLARFSVDLAETDHTDKKAIAALFRELEEIARESAETYENAHKLLGGAS